MKGIGLALSMAWLAAPLPGSAQQVAVPVPGAVEPVVVSGAPVPVRALLHARPFRLASGFRYEASAERPFVTSGVIVVLAVDPAMVVPRDALQPVLYAGDIPVQRLNHGHRSGRVIGIVPGVTDVSGLPFWFGAPELPERVTAQMARAERARAEAQGIRPFAAAKVRGVAARLVRAADASALLRGPIADLLIRYSPAERELAEQWRLPVVRAPTRRYPVRP